MHSNGMMLIRFSFRKSDLADSRLTKKTACDRMQFGIQRYARQGWANITLQGTSGCKRMLPAVQR